MINRIEALKNTQDIWIYDNGELKAMVKDYFLPCYMDDGDHYKPFTLLTYRFPLSGHLEWQQPNQDSTGSEIKCTISEMGAYKALSTDGF